MPITFALFQGIMPLIGYYIGSLFFSYVEGYIGYITAGIFFVLTGKILFDIIKDAKEEKNGTNSDEKKTHKFTIWILLIQAVATSIDALAVGVTLVSSTISIFVAIGIIAGVTFLLVSVALLIGKYLGAILGKYATYVGAILLFALAVKNLVQAII
jgi:putative Mn2+ efflux pump MntP